MTPIIEAVNHDAVIVGLAFIAGALVRPLLDKLKALALKTETKLDDEIVAKIDELINEAIDKKKTKAVKASATVAPPKTDAQ